MKIKNDFPDVDRVISKLKRYSDYFEDMKKSNPEKIEDCDLSLSFLDDFINSIQKYLDSVCNSEDRIKSVKEYCKSPEEIKDFVMSEDNNRTRYHSNIIESMIMIDRVAEMSGLQRVFDYAEEFQSEYSKIVPTTYEEKANMTERERIKRREMGNFGLYIAASATAGLSIEDRNIRDFASCESDVKGNNVSVYDEVKKESKKVKDNIERMIK